jgi:hypothetical protein
VAGAEAIRWGNLLDSPVFFVSYSRTAPTPHTRLTQALAAAWGDVSQVFLVDLCPSEFADFRETPVRINERSFTVVFGELVDDLGRRYRRGFSFSLLRRAANDDDSALRRSTGSERAAGVREIRIVAPLDRGDTVQFLVARLASQVARRLSRAVAKESGFLTRSKIASSVRRLLRSAIGRVLAIRRCQRVEEQPEALTHQHVVDQYRIRGPDAVQVSTMSFALFARELAAA